MYVLRVEIELDPREARDDVEAREQAKTIFAELNLGKIESPCDAVKVKLQKRLPNQTPRNVSVSS